MYVDIKVYILFTNMDPIKLLTKDLYVFLQGFMGYL